MTDPNRFRRLEVADGPLFSWSQTVSPVPTGSRNRLEPVPGFSEPIADRESSFTSNHHELSPVPAVPAVLWSSEPVFRNDTEKLDPVPKNHPYGGTETRNRSRIPLSPISSPVAAGNGGPSRGSRPGPVLGSDPSEQADLNIAIRSLPDPKPPEPRPYQIAAITAVEDQWRAGTKRTLLVLPTGTGKTVVFAELARRGVANDERWLVLAHRTELLTQAIAKLAAVGLRASLDKGTDRASLHTSVVVASVQTLRGARLERYAADHFTHIVVDEGHHSAAKSYQNILARFPAARVLGVTATPDRADGKALGKTYESVAYTYEMRAAIREGFLAPLRARRVLVADVDLSSVKSHHGDFDQGELGAVMAAEKALHGVVGPLVQLAGRRKTLVFGVDVAHAKALAEMLNRHTSGCAIALDGSASDAERAAVLRLFHEGKFQFLTNCALFVEGFDEPSIECVAMVRPTQSRALYTQMLGRGTRLSPLTGKTDCLILDFVGNSKHRLVGPVDALAGHDLDDAVIESLGDLDGQMELEDVLVHAELEAASKRARLGLIAIAHFRTKEIDPFLGDFMPPLDLTSPAAKKPATDKQLAALEKAGIAKSPTGLTLGEASQLLDAITARRVAGLCTIPQARLLERLGADTKGMSMARASQLMAILTRPPLETRFKPYRIAHEPEFRRTSKRT